MWQGLLNMVICNTVHALKVFPIYGVSSIHAIHLLFTTAPDCQIQDLEENTLDCKTYTVDNCLLQYETEASHFKRSKSVFTQCWHILATLVHLHVV